MRRGAPAILLSIVVLAGCGGARDDPYASLTQADREAVAAAGDQANAISDRNGAFISAANEQRLPRARRELEAVRREIAKLRAETASLRSSGLRSGLVPFVDAWRDYARAADRYLTYYEGAISQDMPKERRLRQGIEDAAQRVALDERSFRETVLRTVSGS